MPAHSTTPSDEGAKSGDMLDLSAFFRLVGEAETAAPDQAVLEYAGRPLSWWRRLWEVSTVRKAVLLLLLATAWHQRHCLASQAQRASQCPRARSPSS